MLRVPTRRAEGLLLPVPMPTHSRIDERLAALGLVLPAPLVMNGFSELILAVFGENVGRHARTAVGVSALPMDFPIEIEAEVMILPG